jgi:hypothetical protein
MNQCYQKRSDRNITSPSEMKRIFHGLHIFQNEFFAIFRSSLDLVPIAVATRSKVLTIFARSNTGIVGSNPTQGMDVCLRLFCVLSCVGSGLATG